MNIKFIAELVASPLHRASHVTRYSSRPVTHPENIAEHAFYVTVYSFLLANELELEGFMVNRTQLLSRALFHDVDECITGDFQRAFKYSTPELAKAIHDAAANEVATLFEPFGHEISCNVYDSWKNAKEGDLVGDIVRTADLLAVIVYIYRELQFGNATIREIIPECLAYSAETMRIVNPPPLKDIIAAGSTLLSRAGGNND
ncbi:MAG: HD domain-containing protein [Magnetococcus sp. WYHC-3]